MRTAFFASSRRQRHYLCVLAIACLTQGNLAASALDPALPVTIDLKPFLTEVFQAPDGIDNTYHSYAGRRTLDGLPFNITGEIRLFGKENADRNKVYLDAIMGIKIGHKFDELHLVHDVTWREYYGCPVATIRLHYADGSSFDFPIRFDFQVNDQSRLLTENEEFVADPDTKIIWRGDGYAEGTGRLFKSVLHNPHSEKRVDSMDLISTHSGCTYELLAATIAQRDARRKVTPPLPLLPSRHFDGTLNVHVVDWATGLPSLEPKFIP